MIIDPQIEKLSDEEIVDLTIKNQDFFIYLINRYKIKLGYYINRLTNIRPEDIEDLLQEIFLKIYLNLNDFDHSLKFSSWIYSITHNQIINNYRKIQARPEGHATAIDNDLIGRLASEFNITAEIDQNYLNKNVSKILEQLKQKYREILVLKFFAEKDYQEISDIIKKPIGTVGSMMNKAKQEFKKELEKQKIKI